jgi:autotransporter-associated beta strand protein
VTLPRASLLALFACVALAARSSPASGQTTFTWNNTGADWSTSTNWTPAGPPTGSDHAQFNLVGTYGTATINQPTWGPAPAEYGLLNLSTSAQFTGWNFTSAGSLTQFRLGAAGPVTHTFNGSSLLGGANGLVIDVEHGTTLALAGASTAPNDTVALNIHGGTFRLDNSLVNNTNRIGVRTSNGQGVFLFGGTLDFVGNANGSTETIEILKLTPSFSRVNVENHSTTAPTVLTFSAFDRPLASAINFANTGPVGTLGAAGNNPRIMLTGQAAGFMGSWATVNGAELAVYDTVNGVRAAVNADFAQVYTTTIGTNLAQGEFGALNQSAGTPNVTWSGAAGAGTGAVLRILPGASGQSLTFALDSGNPIDLRGIVLSGPRNYAINGNAGAAVTGFGDHRTFGVLDANATLTFNVPIAAQAGFGIVKYGDGILDLAADMTGTGFIAATGNVSTPMYLNAGVLRANVAPNGSLSKTSGQRINFRGGILEIAGGLDGTGTDADFIYALGTGVRNVNWSDAASHGSGGFSAFGSNASVNIGGNALPDTLLWRFQNNLNFLWDGVALKFGSSASSARLRWLNPVNLDNGTPGDYKLREIEVTRGVGGLNDYTQMTGALGGSNTTDLMKTGSGVLELTGLNTYQGNTLIHAGTLAVGASASLGTAVSRTGNVVVGKGAVLAGTGDILPEVDHFVMVNPGGAIRGGSPVTNSLSEHTGTLSIFSDVTITSTATDRGTIQFEFHRQTAISVTASKIALGAPFNLNLNPGAGNQFALELVDTGVTTPPIAGETYTVTLASVGITENIRLNGVNLTDGVIPNSNYILQSSSFSFDSNYSLAVLTDGTGSHLQLTFALAPVPEPAAVLAFAAGSLALGRIGRHRRQVAIATP